ncbi:MbtH family protein [Xenorhabdus sp. 12]|uniref:MbtH family protein n=1 Tax=Xenorhabdus santafensis TaxID=2582833 RepID=A0ABU4SEY1_9GAMM|nr:MbtH family NRPS accessory protein [Xenorhabdus sp. 12]MDX7989361.1 MbtH family protein [Xenorhabdus sp. 12]
MKQLTVNDVKGNGDMDWAVVINSKKQYSIWPSEGKIPMGWMATGKVGAKDECLNHIAAIWPEPTK